MLQSFRERLTLVLLALLPLHALLVTVLTKFMAGPGHRPLAALALWKEGVLGLLLIIAILEIAIAVEIQRRLGALKVLMFWRKPVRLKLDVLDKAILCIVCYGLILSFILHVPFKQFALGFKYDFLPLVAFFVLRRVEWSDRFRVMATRILIAVGVLLAIYGFATLVLPMSFFVGLGYSDLHSLYVADGPLAAFQQIGGSALRRMQSAMSGPNQLGIWLLIPLGLLMGSDWTKKEGRNQKAVVSILLFTALLLTLSRAAWVGALLMIAWAVCLHVNRRMLLPIITLSVSFLLCVGATAVTVFPEVIFRASSSSDHLKKPVEALQLMAAHPFGLGLGAAGPASNAVTDTCIKLDAGADASWAEARQDLCVFVADQQVQPPLPDGELRPAGQPAGQACDCPVLTENWYLQWGVEMGVVGLIVSLMLAFLVLGKRSAVSDQRSAILAFLGVSIAGLFLHSFEDAAVAYTVWILLATVSKL